MPMAGVLHSMTRQHALVTPILALAAAAFLATSGVASAIYVVTPLALSFSSDHAQAGDRLTLTLGPNPEHENGTTYANAQVVIRYSWDPNEEPASEDPDQPVSSEDRQPQEMVEGEVDAITLDAGAKGTTTWTVPAEADDHNVFFQVLDPDTNETLASGHVPVGDAPPVMAILAGSGPAEPAPRDGELGGTPPAQEENADDDAAKKDTPGVALVGALAALGLAAVVLARRRG